MNWLITNYLEIISVLTGLVYILLSVKQSIWLWPLGIASSAFFVVVFFKSKLYCDMGLNAYYVVVSLYGWYFWIFGSKNEGKKQIDVITCKRDTWIALAIITGLASISLGFVMKKYTDSNVPYIDATLAAGSIVATWMLTRKILENWIAWVVIDLLYCGLYAYKGLYFSIVLFAVYTLMSFWGYRDWKKSMNS